jgi:hypothetical protein
MGLGDSECLMVQKQVSTTPLKTVNFKFFVKISVNLFMNFSQEHIFDFIKSFPGKFHRVLEIRHNTLSVYHFIVCAGAALFSFREVVVTSGKWSKFTLHLVSVNLVTVFGDI